MSLSDFWNSMALGAGIFRAAGASAAMASPDLAAARHKVTNTVAKIRWRCQCAHFVIVTPSGDDKLAWGCVKENSVLVIRGNLLTVQRWMIINELCDQHPPPTRQ